MKLVLVILALVFFALAALVWGRVTSNGNTVISGFDLVAAGLFCWLLSTVVN